jgi:hypothetical protein
MFEGVSSCGEVTDSPVLDRSSPRSVSGRGKALDPGVAWSCVRGYNSDKAFGGCCAHT